MKNKFYIKFSIVLSVFCLLFGVAFVEQSTVVSAATDISKCKIELSFLENNNPVTVTTILLNAKNSYKLNYKVTTPEGCAAPLYWKISLQQYGATKDTAEPVDVPTGTQIKSGIINNNNGLSGSVALSKPSLGNYAYTMFVSSDETFSSSANLITKQFSVKFTNNAKEVQDAKNAVSKPGGSGGGNNGNTAYKDTSGKTYDGQDWNGELSILNPVKLGGQEVNDISQLATKIINWLLLIIGIVSTVMIIYAGVLLVFNAGNESQVKKAKTTIIWAVLGLVVSLCAFAIVNIIQSLL